MNRLSALMIIGTFVLAACGGGGGNADDDATVDSRTGSAIAFVDWGNPSGEVVRDGNLEAFKFTAGAPNAPSCLFAVKSKTVLPSFCRAADRDDYRYVFVERYLDVRSAKFPDGTCHAAIVDVATASIVSVYVQNGGATVVTGSSPAGAC